jgi:hypothetical protein
MSARFSRNQRNRCGHRPHLQCGIHFKTGDWNQVHIIARGNTLLHIINGRTMSIFIDDDPTMAAAQGAIGLQIDGTGEVSFRNLRLKNL